MFIAIVGWSNQTNKIICNFETSANSIAHHKCMTINILLLATIFAIYYRWYWEKKNPWRWAIVIYAFMLLEHSDSGKCSNVNNNREHREHRTLNPHILLCFMVYSTYIFIRKATPLRCFHLIKCYYSEKTIRFDRIYHIANLKQY